IALPSAFAVLAISSSLQSRAAIARSLAWSATIARARSIAHWAKSLRDSITMVSIGDFCPVEEIFRFCSQFGKGALSIAYALAGQAEIINTRSRIAPAVPSRAFAFAGCTRVQ